MKTLKIIDLKTKEVEKELPIKKTFEFEGEKFTIAKDSKSLELFHYRSGGRVIGAFHGIKTINGFYEYCLKKLTSYYERDKDNFFAVLNKHKTINE